MTVQASGDRRGEGLTTSVFEAGKKVRPLGGHPRQSLAKSLIWVTEYLEPVRHYPLDRDDALQLLPGLRVDRSGPLDQTGLVALAQHRKPHVSGALVDRCRDQPL